MISKEEVKKTVEIICAATNKTQEELSVALGYGKTYISEMFTPKGKVSEKFTRSLQMHLSAIVHQSALENPMVAGDYIKIMILRDQLEKGWGKDENKIAKRNDQRPIIKGFVAGKEIVSSEKLDQSDRDLLSEISINQKATLQYLREIRDRLDQLEGRKMGTEAVIEMKDLIKKGKSSEKDKQSKG